MATTTQLIGEAIGISTAHASELAPARCGHRLLGAEGPEARMRAAVTVVGEQARLHAREAVLADGG